MKKSATVLIIIGFILFAAGVFVIYTGFVSQKSEENGLVFEKKVTAQITDMRVVKSTVGEHNGPGNHKQGTTTYHYKIDLLVTEDGSTYTDTQNVPKYIYEEYSAFEKNNDMEFNMYRNADGIAYFSFKDIEGATEDYQEIQVTKDIAVRMIAGLLTAALGMILMSSGDKLRQKSKKD